jgi:hypothetical protein
MPHENQFIPEVTDSFSARKYILACLDRDLVGPSWKPNTMEADYHETLSLDPKSQPSRFYLTGYLSPHILDDDLDKLPEEEQTHIEATKEDEIPGLAIDSNTSEEDNQLENKIRSGDGLLTPRSIGLTVLPHGINTKWEVDVECNWARYNRIEPYSKDDKSHNWKRTPCSFIFKIRSTDFSSENIFEHEPIEYPGIRLHFRIGSSEHPSLTVRLVNDNEHYKSEWEEITNNTMMQVKINLYSQMGFSDVRNKHSETKDPSMDLLYSNSKVLALGHNIGVNWENDSTNIWTDFLPKHEVPLMRSDDSLNDFIPKLSQLCDPVTLDSALEKALQFVEQYEHWLAEQRLLFESQMHLARFVDVFEKHAAQVHGSIERIKSGTKFLLADQFAKDSFLLANQSILHSQTHPSLSKHIRIKDFEWRPFQFAFQLLNVEGLLKRDHPDREILDLAWFPTGGGKTEAYLGLISMISFHRRLHPDTMIRENEHSGIAAIMRYTLRLLTADQAGRLIRLCGAMNETWKLQTERAQSFSEFTVGMWIGEKASPNKFYNDPRYPKSNSVGKEFDYAVNGDKAPESTILQFQLCPWCGDDSVGEYGNWSIENRIVEGHMVPKLVGRCTGDECIFNQSIPFSCVDEDLYLHPPTILLGTVDKMVQLAQNKYAKSLRHGPESYDNVPKLDSRRMLGFNQNGPLPPDLIIQDELHLLSGPLGTLAGLIETALTVAWKHQGHSPKYVAATATIRGADRDIGLIYGRKLNVFPPPLLTARDNFFAQEQTPTPETPGRIHVGLLAPPRLSRSATDRPTASILQAVNNMRKSGDGSNKLDKILDPYWTLVMYYNSLRELGGGQSSLRQNIPRWMSQYATGSSQSQRDLAEGGDVELTSRKSAKELSVARQRLDIELGVQPQCVDVLSTSNMFQVGVDIPRLGIMSIIGQPRSNSEYIQSSGRVGRKSSKPGLVLSILRGTFPRDQSHYEHFRSFHQEFYRHVDFTSVTPFTHRALDRGFATALMLLLRMGCKDLSVQHGPTKLRGNIVRTEALSLLEKFSNMVRSRQEELPDANPISTNEALDIINGEWDRLQRLVNSTGDPVWWIVWNDKEVQRYNPKPLSWMKSPFRISDMHYPGDLVDGLNSLRDVAEEVQIGEKLSESFTSYSKMPEGHLMSHMAPGNIWEKGGVPYMTYGISRWDNTIANGFQSRTEGAEALNPISDPNYSGQRIEEPCLTTLLGHDKALRLLPKSENDNDWLGQHGAVTYIKYPWIFVCDNSGHIEQNSRWVEGEDFRICKRRQCSSKTSPSRFISMCVDGHISPFDYSFWVHDGSGCNDKSNLRLVLGPDSALTLSNWVIHCDSCNSSRSMLQVPWVKVSNTRDAPNCFGNRIWLGESDFNEADCEHKMVHRQVGNTSVTMNEGGSIMIIPPYVGWDFVDNNMMYRLRDSETKEEFKRQWISDAESNHTSLRRPLAKLEGTAYHSSEDGVDHDAIINALWNYYLQHKGDEILTISNLRSRERLGLTLSDQSRIRMSEKQFSCATIAGGHEEQPTGWDSPSWPLHSASRIDRLTELRYIDGIRRLDPGNNIQPIDLIEARVGPEKTFGIGMYNYGEGLYFDIKPQWIQQYVEKRSETLSPSHAEMTLAADKIRNSLTNQIPSLKKVDARSGFTVLHTFSHLLIKSLASTSGFSLGSIRERLYYNVEEGEIVEAGILLYSSAPSTDGTLGGLVQQGSSISRLDKIVKGAIESLQLCSNDPICREHRPTKEEINGAACHTCVLLPETSCELANFMLDRNWGN